VAKCMSKFSGCMHRKKQKWAFKIMSPKRRVQKMGPEDEPRAGSHLDTSEAIRDIQGKAQTHRSVDQAHQ
jgi:hypothetical protein